MRIGLIKHRFVRSGGGSERYTRGLVDHLRGGGHEVHVFAGSWDQEAEESGLFLHRVSALAAPSFLRQLSFAVKCRQAVEREACDITFSAERTLRQDICRAGGGCHREWLIQRARHSSLVQRARWRLNPLHWTLRWLERQTFSPRNTGRIIANSHRGKEEITRHYQFPGERIVVIHNGVDCASFHPVAKEAPSSVFTLLFVGSGFERKGLRFCVEALSQLPPHVRLLVAGRGDHRPYEGLAARLGVAGRVNFLGATADIKAVYAQGDLLVHPAIYEPFSNACLEAMACGLPVVTSAVNGASEVITPGANGSVVLEPSNANELAAAIRPFLDRDCLRQAAVRARATAAALPMSANVARTLEVFQAVLAEIDRGQSKL